jgi:hypothetical protein
MHSNVLARQFERLLLDWANVPETIPEISDAGARLLRRYPQIFQASLKASQSMILSVRNHLRAAWDAPDVRVRDWYIFRVRQIYKTHLENEGKSFSTSIIHRDILEGIEIKELKNPGSLDLSQLQKYVDALQRLSKVAKMRIWAAPPEDPPPQTQFELAMFHFQRIGNKAAHCKNPGCPAPYFFRTRNNQQYDSPKCSGEAQRESKRRWWREHKPKRPKRKP